MLVIVVCACVAVCACNMYVYMSVCNIIVANENDVSTHKTKHSIAAMIDYTQYTTAKFC